MKRRIGGKGALRGILRPAHPDLKAQGEVVGGGRRAARRRASTTSPSTITASSARTASTGSARRYAGSVTGMSFDGQGRRDHRRRRRHRAGAVPPLRRRRRDRSRRIDKSEAVTAFAAIARARTARSSRHRRRHRRRRRRSRQAFAEVKADPRRRSTSSSTMPASRGHRNPRRDARRMPGATIVNGNLNGTYYCTHAVLPGMKATARRRHRQYRLGQRPLGARRPGLQRRQGGHGQPHPVAGASSTAATASGRIRLSGNRADADLGAARGAATPRS